MSFKSKMSIAFGIAGVVLLSVVIALVATVVVLKSNNSGGVAVSYTAKNISATVESAYMLSGGDYIQIQTTDGADVMTFVGNERGHSVTKSFNKVTDIKLDRNGYLYVRYIITNTNPDRKSSFIVCSMSDIKENSNLNIEYGAGTREIKEVNTNNSNKSDTVQQASVSCEGNKHNWHNQIVKEPDSGWKKTLEEAVSCVRVSYGKPVYVYARFSVATATMDASFDGSFNFSLIAQ